MKAQRVRLVDVFFLGPLMLWAVIQNRPLGDFTRTVLVVGGIATIFYNWRNYVIANLAVNASGYYEFKTVSRKPEGLIEETWHLDRHALFANPVLIDSRQIEG